MHIPFLQIEPTTRCNYTCGFCAGRHLPQGDLPRDQLARLLERIEGLTHVELQGEGEPLLHADFFGLVEELRARFPQVGLSTITNGSLFTERNIEGLLAWGFTRVNVSLESADAARFQAIRGGRFDKLARGLTDFMARRAQLGLTLPAVGLAVTVLRDTRDEVFDTILPFYRRMGLDGGVILQPLQRMPQYTRHYADAMRARIPAPAEMAGFNQRVAATPELIQALRERNRQPGFYERLYASTQGRPVCPWLENGLFLGHDARLSACCFIKDSARFAFGDMDTPPAGIEAARRAMAATLAQGRMPPACQGCGTAQAVARHAMQHVPG